MGNKNNQNSSLNPLADNFIPMKCDRSSIFAIRPLGFNPLNNPAVGLISNSDRTSMEIMLPNTQGNGLNPSAKYCTQEYSNLPGDHNLLNPLAKSLKPNLNPLAPIFIPSN